MLYIIRKSGITLCVVAAFTVSCFSENDLRLKTINKWVYIGEIDDII